MNYITASLIYLAPLLVIVIIITRSRYKRRRHDLKVKNSSINNGLMEPVSLHPVIDPLKCIGCGSCVDACPENRVLGIINNRAELITPSSCIGHGACKSTCPERAITLVFGTENRGVDIPEVSPIFESNIQGIFIAGELGGMGLIRNAIEQGKQAMAAIHDHCKKIPDDPEVLDVVIVGAGPAGIAASLYAVEHKMKYKLLEQDSLGGTVSHFPRGKIVMTSPANLPLVGKVKFAETSKEVLLDFWKKIEKKYSLDISYHERMLSVHQKNRILTVISDAGEYPCKSALIAIGRRGTPRKLGVPGENLGKVFYRLLDPEQFCNCDVLVVGGGDSALEAATSIAEQEGSRVVLSYRGESFNRAKKKNRNKIDELEKLGCLDVLLQSHVREISTSQVDIDTVDGIKVISNHYVLVCVGGVLPNLLLEEIGINVETKFGTV